MKLTYATYYTHKDSETEIKNVGLRTDNKFKKGNVLVIKYC